MRLRELLAIGTLGTLVFAVCVPAKAQDTAAPEFSPADTRHAYRMEIWHSLRPLIARRDGLMAAAVDLEVEIAKARQEVTVLSDDSSQEEKAKHLKSSQEQKQRIRVVHQQRDAILAEKAKVDTQVAILEEKLFAARSREMDMAAIKAKVTEVANGHVKLNLGSNTGLRIGTGLNVFRDEVFVGHVQVIRLREKDSDCAIKFTSDNELDFRSGDQAILLLDIHAARATSEDPGESIYDHKVRQFKFQIGIDAEPAVAGHRFLRRYLSKGHPPVYGAWGDPRTGALVVIAPAESEHAIREQLALDEGVARTGFDVQFDETLEGQLRMMKYEHRKLVHKHAAAQCDLIDGESEGVTEQRLKELQDSVEVLTKKTETCERKIMVLSESVKRLFPRQLESE